MENHAQTESRLLGCFLLDGGTIDRALAAGITAAHWHAPFHGEQFRLLCDLRLAGKSTDLEGIYAATASDPNRLQLVGGIPALLLHQQETSLHAGDLIAAVIANYGVREAHRLFTSGAADLKAGRITADDARGLAEQVVGVCSGQRSVSRSTADVAKEAIAESKARIEGTEEPETLIYTGLPKFDRWAGPIQRHETVVVGGRSSHGKSSGMLQIAGHNLARKDVKQPLRMAIFTIETSSKAVIKQMAAQRVGVNLRHLELEMPEKQQRFLKALEWLGQCKNLLIFDSDMTMPAISARCRLLAQSFKPDAVFLDYLQLAAGADGTEYERVSAASKSCIPLQKSLGCPLFIGSQLNQGSEKEEREPNRTDFRGSGQILEDCHRAIVFWRKPGQSLDQTFFDTEILQLKNRDGALCKVQLQYNAPHTTFREVNGGN